MKTAVITGASSGLGAEFARQLNNSSSIERIWVIARRKERLLELKNSLGSKIFVIALDLADESSIAALKDLALEHKPDVKILINCAGYGIRKQFEKASLKEQTGMVDLNCRALLAVTYVFLPYMKKNSKITMLASSAGFLSQPGFAVYSATKAFVINLSKALNRELKDRKITVTAVCPGPVDTEFFNVSDRGGKPPAYKKLFMAKPYAVVNKALKDTCCARRLSVYGMPVKLLKIAAKIIN